MNVGKYLEPASNGNGNYSVTNPTARLVTNSGVRAWTDFNKNFIPDCDLLNMSPNLECGQGNANFGKQVLATTYDPAILGGWGVRPTDWGLGASVQQQVLPRVSVEVGYTRRWLNNFTVSDNILVAPSDFGAFSVTAPSDSRLPGGGGYTVSNLYDVNPNKSGQSSFFATYASFLPGSPLQYQRYNGMLINFSARPRNGFTFQGGINTGKTVTDNCAVRAILPETNILGGVTPTNPYCHNEPGFITRFTAIGTYVIPKVDVNVSGTMRSDQGAVLAANWAVPNSIIAPSLGRNLSEGSRMRRSTSSRPEPCGAIASTRSTCTSGKFCGSGGRARTSGSTSTT